MEKTDRKLYGLYPFFIFEWYFVLLYECWKNIKFILKHSSLSERHFLIVGFRLKKSLCSADEGKGMADKLEGFSRKSKEKDVLFSRENFVRGNAQNPKKEYKS